jgi:hypothetical protein
MASRRRVHRTSGCHKENTRCSRLFERIASLGSLNGSIFRHREKRCWSPALGAARSLFGRCLRRRSGSGGEECGAVVSFHPINSCGLLRPSLTTPSGGLRGIFQSYLTLGGEQHLNKMAALMESSVLSFLLTSPLASASDIVRSLRSDGDPSTTPSREHLRDVQGYPDRQSAPPMPQAARARLVDQRVASWLEDLPRPGIKGSQEHSEGCVAG